MYLNILWKYHHLGVHHHHGGFMCMIFSCFKSMGHFCSDHGYPCWSQLCYALFLWSYIASMPAVFASLDQWLNWPYPWAKHIIIWGASFGILVMCAMNFMCCFLANTPIQVVLAICRMSSSLNFQAQFWLTHTWFLFLMYLSILWNYHHLGGGLEPMPDFPGLWKIQKVTCINMLCSTPFSETNLYPLP